MVLLLVMTVYALCIQLFQFYREHNWFLLGLDIVVLIAAVLVVLQVGAAISKGLKVRRQSQIV